MVLSITSILISRFIVNLQEVCKVPGTVQAGGRFRTMSQSRLSSYLTEHIGGDLQYEFDGDSEQDDISFPRDLRHRGGDEHQPTMPSMSLGA